MGRKRKYEDDGSTTDESMDDAEDFEENEDFQEFNGAFRRKRREKPTEEDKMLGIWAESDEEAPRPTSKRSTKGMSFVKSSTINNDEDVSEKWESDASSRSSSPKRIPLDAMEEDDLEELNGPQTHHFGLGMANTPNTPDSTDTRQVRHGPASKKFQPERSESPQLPAIFGRKGPKPKPPPTTDSDLGKFEKHTKGIGARLLAKMGWTPGAGLGKEGEGIVEPIDVKVRPKNLGLAFNSFREQTKTVIEIEKKVKERHGIRYGDLEKSDEEPEDVSVVKKPKSDGWKKGVKRVKQTVTYKTVEELGEIPTSPMKIIDMTGPGGGREVEVGDLKGQRQILQELEDSTKHLPELRHNLHLIVDLARHDLNNAIHKKRQEDVEDAKLTKELQLLTKDLEKETLHLERLAEIKRLIKELETKSFSLANLEFDEAMQQLEPTLESLQNQPEYQTYQLDEAVVASIAPMIKRLYVDWKPLQYVDRGSASLAKWRRLLLSEKSPSPYDSLLNTYWLPRVRQAINNDWSVYDSEPMISFVETWHPSSETSLIPSWLFDVIMDTLILPKITRTLSDWSPKKQQVPLHVWLVPWLPILGDDRIKSLLETVRQKMISGLQDWKPTDVQIITLLQPWEKVLRKRDFDAILSRAIFPKLSSTLRYGLRVEPGQQDVAPLQSVFAWFTLAQDAVIQLLLQDFFPRWHTALWQWLSYPACNFEEVATWYTIWKYQVFPESIRIRLSSGFRKALDLMNMAMDVRTRLNGEFDRVVLPTSKTKVESVKVQTTNLTFRDYLEQRLAEHNYTLEKSDKLHEVTSKPLLKIKGPKTMFVYLDDNVVFVKRDRWQPIDIDQLLTLL